MFGSVFHNFRLVRNSVERLLISLSIHMEQLEKHWIDFSKLHAQGQLNNITRNRVVMSARHHNTYDTQALTVGLHQHLYEQHTITYEVPTSRQQNAAQRIPHK
jgi:hypothetical protein